MVATKYIQVTPTSMFKHTYSFGRIQQQHHYHNHNNNNNNNMKMMISHNDSL